MKLHPGQHEDDNLQIIRGGANPSDGSSRQNDTWYHDLAIYGEDLLCIHNLQGRLLSVNPRAARLLGYSIQELLQLPMREVIPPEFRIQFDEYLREVEQSGTVEGLLTVMTSSGARRL